jgi:hypothetical protein
MFHIGQKVVCVTDHGQWTGAGDGNWPSCKKGTVYTIRDIDARCIEHYGVVGIRVEELVLPLVDTEIGLFEPAFHPRRFRPVIERKTDISVFTRILDKVNKRETVNG